MANTNEVTKFIDESSIENIYNTYTKIIGIETNPDLITHNNKNIGLVILISGNTKFFLGNFIEYNIKKVKWKGNKYDNDGKLLFLIDPYWCKNYKPMPFIKVPIKVYNPKTNSVIEDFRNMNKNQFIKHSLIEFYGDWPHRLVIAVENFNKLRNKGYYYAINSTVRNYRIDKDILQNAIAKVNRKLDSINKKWNELFTQYYENKETLKMVHEMIESNKKDNVIDFKSRMNL